MFPDQAAHPRLRSRRELPRKSFDPTLGIRTANDMQDRDELLCHSMRPGNGVLGQRMLRFPAESSLDAADEVPQPPDAPQGFCEQIKTDSKFGKA